MKEDPPSEGGGAPLGRMTPAACGVGRGRAEVKCPLRYAAYQWSFRFSYLVIVLAERLSVAPLCVFLPMTVRKPFYGDIAHFVASAVQFFACGLPRHFGVEGKEKHSPFGAEPLVISPRMPSCAEALRREHDQPSPGMDDGVAACLLARAHERPDPHAYGRGCAYGRYNLISVALKRCAIMRIPFGDYA